MAYRASLVEDGGDVAIKRDCSGWARYIRFFSSGAVLVMNPCRCEQADDGRNCCQQDQKSPRTGFFGPGFLRNLLAVLFQGRSGIYQPTSQSRTPSFSNVSQPWAPASMPAQARGKNAFDRVISFNFLSVKGLPRGTRHFLEPKKVMQIFGKLPVRVVADSVRSGMPGRWTSFQVSPGCPGGTYLFPCTPLQLRGPKPHTDVPSWDRSPGAAMQNAKCGWCR